MKEKSENDLGLISIEDLQSKYPDRRTAVIDGLLRRGEIMLVCDRSQSVLMNTPERFADQIEQGSIFGQRVLADVTDFLIIDYKSFMMGFDENDYSSVSLAFREMESRISESGKSAIILRDMRCRKIPDRKGSVARNPDTVVELFEDRITFESRSFESLPDFVRGKGESVNVE